jgi:23S rRNA (pseudouridine1915-N3)-methyltransferase
VKFEVVFLGKTREKYLDQGICDYAERLRRYVPLEIKVLKNKNKHAKNDSDQVIMAREAEQLLSQVKSASLTVALDPNGCRHSSEELARILEKWENQGLQTISFLIGGHLGLTADVIARAGTTWSLSRLTFTHEMSRFILLEQLYRACSIKANHNYHK